MEDIFAKMKMFDPNLGLEKINIRKPYQYSTEYQTLNEAVIDARKLDHISYVMKWAGKFYISTVENYSICTVDPGHKETILKDFNRPDDGAV